MNSFNLKVGIAPCKGCKNRHLGCHDKCNKYLEWKKANTNEAERINKIKREEATLYDVKEQGIQNIKNKKNKFTVIKSPKKI